ncbi:hypothetical protein GCM10023145_02680 [Angustibacter luteus]
MAWPLRPPVALARAVYTIFVGVLVMQAAAAPLSDFFPGFADVISDTVENPVSTVGGEAYSYPK